MIKGKNGKKNKLYKSECYCTNLRRSAGFVSDFYDKAMEETGLTAAQYYLLINLSRLKAVNVTHWAERVGLDRSTMIRNIRVLENHGYIELSEGHGKVYTLTQHGTDTLEATVPIWNKAQKQIETFLGKEDADAILRIGSKLQLLEETI